MDRLDQLFARSLREIEPHSTGLADTVTGRYLINEAGRLLAALRLWARRTSIAPTRASGRSSRPPT